MNKILQIFIIFCLTLSTVHASERTSALISADAILALDTLQAEKLTLTSNIKELSTIEKNLRKTRKGQAVYLQMKQIAGTLLIIGIVIGSYKAYFPPGFRAMLGAYVTVEGLSHGLVKLNEKEVIKILDDITKLHQTVKAHEKQIEVKGKYYCKQEPRHVFCYDN